MLRISRTRCRRALTVMVGITLALCSAACRATSAKAVRDYMSEAEAVAEYCVEKAECFFCGSLCRISQSELLGQNNVGIISLNTFELLPIEINRYEQGRLLEENTGVMQVRSFHLGDESCSVYSMVDADRGIANVTVSPKGNLELNMRKAADHLCEDCLTEFAAQLHGDSYSIGILNFSTIKLYALRQSIIGFGAGDYHVHVDYDLPDFYLLITYNPLRYADSQQ